MPAVDFDVLMKEADKAQGSGDYLKLKEGANKFRLLTPGVWHVSEYQGRPNSKWLCYVLDRADGKIKLFFMAHRIWKQIAQLSKSDDYGFRDVPMPYDLTVHAKNAGTKEVEYTLTPARKETPLSFDEEQLFKAAKPIEDIKKALDDKAAKHPKPASHDDDDVPPITDDDIFP